MSTVIVGPLLLLNLLIAIFTDSVADVNQYKDVVLPIQRLNVLLVLQGLVKHPSPNAIWRWMKRSVKRKIENAGGMESRGFTIHTLEEIIHETGHF